ncbi:hypothetical protein Rsub_11780 [Raphidocelis subcapitata]|uniref:Uncharacterized protein n=1 Tax=Raphidocelis subcapitata TaxID=307507 RepID=A0A2V0PPY2_9CHLO|nr:hypothetical protein Rsub_11780 [Raphidocelis subcapitata]|eukprot:GBF99255.1 hypothetical protein Rsub_11780 [Raphidocelis subcapitata]
MEEDEAADAGAAGVVAPAQDQDATRCALDAAVAHERAGFKLQLRSILADVAAEEDARRTLQAQLRAARSREAQLREKLAALKADHAAVVNELRQQHAALGQLQAALQAGGEAEAAAAGEAAAQRAADAAALRGARQAVDALRAESAALREDLKAAAQQQAALAEALAQRDARVAGLLADAEAARRAAAARAAEAERMEGVLRATGERAAASEQEAAEARAAAAAGRAEAAAASEKLHAALAELRPLRGAAAEAAGLREQLAAATTAAAALASARDRAQAAADGSAAAAAAAVDRARRLSGLQALVERLVATACDRGGSGAGGDLQSIIAAGGGGSGEQQAAAAAGAPTAPVLQEPDELAAALQQRLREALELGPKLAACEAAAEQQRRHIARLAAEADRARGEAEAAREQARVERSLSVQLQAELRRALAAAAGGSPAAGADAPAGHAHAARLQLLGRLHDVASELRARAAEAERHRGADGGALSAPAAQATRAAERLGAASARLDGLLARLQAGGDPAVASAHLDATAGELRQLRSGLGGLAAGLDDGQRQLERAGAAAAAALAAAEAAEGALDAAAARAEAAAGGAAAWEGEAAEAAPAAGPPSWGSEAVKAIRAAEARLLASGLGDACGAAPGKEGSGGGGGLHSSLGPWLAGDAPAVAAAAAVRDASAALREAAGALLQQDATTGAGGGDGGGGAALAAELRAAASSLGGCAKQLRRLKAAAAAAALSNAACLETAAAGRRLIGDAVAVLERLDGPPLAGGAAGGDGARQQLSLLDVPLGQQAPGRAEAEAEADRLQLEAAALRGLLAARDSRIRELEKRQRQLLSGNEELVPANLLAAVQESLDAAEARRHEAQRDAERAAERRVATAAAFVDRAADALLSSAAAQALQRWRANALAARVFALHERLAAAQAEAEALLCARQLRAEAVAAYLERQPCGRLRAWTLRAALLAWQRHARRQLGAGQAWRVLAEAAAEAAGGGEPAEPTLAARLLQRRRQAWGAGPATAAARGGGLVWELSAARLLAASFDAWRCAARQAAAWRRLRAAEARLEGLSCGLPAWVRHLGDRRRIERAWLALRLASCGAAAARLRRQRSRRPTQERPLGVAPSGEAQQTEAARPVLLVPEQPSPTVQQRAQPRPRPTEEEGQASGEQRPLPAAPEEQAPPPLEGVEWPAVEALELRWPEPPQQQSLLPQRSAEGDAAVLPPNRGQPQQRWPAEVAGAAAPPASTTLAAAVGPAAAAPASCAAPLEAEARQQLLLLKRRATASLLERGGSTAMTGGRVAAAVSAAASEKPAPAAAMPQRQRRRTTAAFGRTLSSPSLRAAGVQPTQPAEAGHHQQQLATSSHEQPPARLPLLPAPAKAQPPQQQAGSRRQLPGAPSMGAVAPAAGEPRSPPVQVVCTRFLGLRDSLEAVAGELTMQTRALFSAGRDAASPGGAVPSPRAAAAAAAATQGLADGAGCVGAAAAAGRGTTRGPGPLPLLGAVPGGATAAHMADWTDGLHAAARPWLRRSAAEAAAGEGAARVLGTLPGSPPQAAPFDGGRFGSVVAAQPMVDPAEMTAEALQWATGTLAGTQDDYCSAPGWPPGAAGGGAAPSQQPWASVVVDARPPSVGLPASRGDTADAAAATATQHAAAAASLSLRAGRSEQWRAAPAAQRRRSAAGPTAAVAAAVSPSPAPAQARVDSAGGVARFSLLRQPAAADRGGGAL